METPDKAPTPTPAEPDPKALSERFVLQVTMFDPDAPETWDSLQSFASPSECLVACSECAEAIQLMLGIDPIRGPDLAPSIRLRVWDQHLGCLLLWEDEEGILRWEDSAFPESSPPEPEAEFGININDSARPWTAWILDGVKTMDTRDHSTLRPYVGKRVGIVRTGMGPATLLGYVTISEERQYHSREEFARDYEKHRVPPDLPGFEFRQAKFGYVLENPRRTPPQRITSRGIIARRLPEL